MLDIIFGLLQKRDVEQDIRELPETLSSWDKCMEKNFCKYPVIAGCIVGGIIILSCLWCLIRCCMCGVACCSCCCGGCGGKKKVTHVEFGAAPPIYTPPAYHESPKYAYERDRSGNVTADALPAMPTWEATKVEVKEEVELGYVNNDSRRRDLTPAPVMPKAAMAEEGYLGGGQRGMGTGSRGPSPVPLQAPIPMGGQQVGFNPRGMSPGPYSGGNGYPQQQQQRAPSPVQPYPTAAYGENPDYTGGYQQQQQQQQLGGWSGRQSPAMGRQQQDMYPPSQGQQRSPTYQAFGGASAGGMQQGGGVYPGQGQQQYRGDDDVYHYDERQKRQQEWSAL